MDITQIFYDNLAALGHQVTASDISDVVWKFPQETDFYQPIVVAKSGGCYVR